MIQNVNYYSTQVQVNPLCQNHFTRDANHSTLCQSSLQQHREYKLETVQCVSALFIIPVIVDIHGHRFKIYTLVSEIHENVDLVLGIKNIFELKGAINSRDYCFKFLNRSVPIYPEKEIILKPDKQKLVKVKTPFVDESSGLAIIKILDGGTYSTLLIKLKFTCNRAILDIMNKGKDTMILRPEEMIGIIDLRSLRYYKFKQGILQQNLSRYYRFEKAEKLCKYFNKFVNTL